MSDPIRVLVVDDSALMRQMISRFLTEAGMEVVGTARDGQEGYALARILRPHVITLDVEMPKMDGLAMLRRLMAETPTPVVMLSSLTHEAAPATVEALSLGAIDVVGKPGGGISLNLHEVRNELVEKVRVASQVRLNGNQVVTRPTVAPTAPGRTVQEGIVIIGTSTGGPSALTQVLPHLPGSFPLPIAVVQHMPPGFTASLAHRLDSMSKLTVREATGGTVPKRGEVWFAPGGRHLVFSKRRLMQLNESPPHLGVRPAVDVTVESAVDRWGAGVILVILTGMGMDGAKGARRVKQAGGHVIAQDESSCVVYGMPRAVVEMGNADVVSALQDVPAHLLKLVHG